MRIVIDVHPIGGTKIILKYEGKCRDCGTVLEVGEEGRWYGRGIVYGVKCHADTRKEVESDG